MSNSSSTQVKLQISEAKDGSTSYPQSEIWKSHPHVAEAAWIMFVDAAPLAALIHRLTSHHPQGLVTSGLQNLPQAPRIPTRLFVLGEVSTYPGYSRHSEYPIFPLDVSFAW